MSNEKKELSENNSNAESASESKIDYKSVYDRERNFFAFTVLVLPLFIFALLLYFLESIPTSPNGYFSIFFVVLIIYAIGFGGVYAKTPSLPRKSKRDRIQKILGKFGYEKIVIRQSFFDKYRKISIIVLIITSIIVGFGYQFSTEEIKSNNIEYFEKVKEFNSVHDRVEKMNHDELKIFLNEQISEMYYPHQYEMFLRDITLEEIITFEEGESINQDLSDLSTVIESLSKEETISFVQQKLSNLEDDELLKSTKIIINYSEPRAIFYDNSEFYRLQNFLLGILFIRFFNDVFMEFPSIVLGIFAFLIIVLVLGHFSIWAGAFALALIMFPIVTRTTEESLKMVPMTYREAGMALGLKKWVVTMRIVISAAKSGMITGILLSVSRIGGETAPLIMTILGSSQFFNSLDTPMDALPLRIWRLSLLPYDSAQLQGWGSALVLIMIILGINLVVRFYFMKKGRSSSLFGRLLRQRSFSK